MAGLSVRYGNREVLRGLNLQLGRSEIFGLLGPNGAGKTTLIRTICGRVRACSGQVSVAGETGKKSMRHIGLVPQELALYPYLTVRENLEAFGRLSGLSATETSQAITWASQATDITQRLDERVDILSGGWKRRVNIAAAILHHPDLLILDEPTVGVDVEARNVLHDVLVHLSRAGMGILLTTHDLDQAEALCTTVGFLRDGKITPQGTPRGLIADAFGKHREVILELRHLATPDQSAILHKAGFSPLKGGYSWIMLTGASSHSLERLSIALNKAGIETREIRFREPGLDSLFVSLTRDAEVAP
ncbi:MAG: ABC transporter ATP-binding protein [Devosia sp.]|uniref:ABC transporter ATP-binding protein n=1 Tax=Devosia sp. TaxID=1871048 RepID=UPI0019DDA594|nr:ABC transporter ATP-binding protein [Devosia sp.]MBF0679878.1 ABC transporter ATP-binding protein [Devosia sp.]